MHSTVDVAIVGAGPYGLSVAAHLRDSGASLRAFGSTMHLWRDKMPPGMFLKSQGYASNLSDPQGSHTLAAFCRAAGRPYADYGLPVPLTDFVAYGDWFAGEMVPGLEDTHVTNIAAAGAGFELTLATGEQFSARRVVVAAGVQHFAYVPYTETAESALGSLEAELMVLVGGSAGVEHHERPEYADRIAVLRQELHQLPDGFVGLFTTLSLAVSIGVTGYLLRTGDPLPNKLTKSTDLQSCVHHIP